MQRRTVHVRNDADVALVVVAVRALARGLELDDLRTTRLATVASELATNVAKYARRGTITVESGRTGRRHWVAITSDDIGPGIADVDAALTDHYSTGGSLGLGLPGVKRLTPDLRIHSRPGEGCTIVARMWLDA